MTHQTSLVAYQAYAKLTVLSGAWWDTQHCLPGQELNWCYLSDIIQDAWGQRKLKVTNTCCPEPKLNCRSTCRVGQNTYCFFFFLVDSSMCFSFQASGWHKAADSG